MNEFAELRVRAQSPDRWEEVLARVGLVAKGVSYGLVGVLAAGVAAGVGGKTTSRQGALHQLAGNGLGEIVLILLTAGFAAYALWRLVQAARVDEDSAAKEWGKRAGYLGRAAIYVSLAITAGKIVAGAGGGGSSNGKTHQATAVVLSWPGGTWLVGAAGLVVIAVGIWNLYRGLSRKFEDKWVGGRSDAAQRWGGYAGVAGHSARFVVFSLIGVFAVRAAIDYNPKDAVGLDGALQKLAHQSYGPALLGITAVGLAAYGVYCLVDARYRDVSA
jgi:Domain of Unknown Function (DUF1206)